MELKIEKTMSNFILFQETKLSILRYCGRSTRFFHLYIKEIYTSSLIPYYDNAERSLIFTLISVLEIMLKINRKSVLFCYPSHE